MHTIIFDTETTGLLKPSANSVDEQPEIVELYAVKINEDWEMVDEFESFFKPKIPLTEETTNIHGISNEMVADAPSFGDKFEELALFFKGSDEIVAHNLAFDRSMLANELIRIDKLLFFPWPRRHICTVEMAMPIEQRRINLSNLHRYATGNEFVGAHRAKIDVHALVRCFHWMRDTKQMDLPSNG